MSTTTHRAPKMITPRKATAVAVVGLSAGSVALIPGSSQAETLSQAKIQYQQDLTAGEVAEQTYVQEEQAYAQLQQKIDDLLSQISNQNQQISTLDAAIGQQAAQQYRNGGLSNTLELTLSASPTTYLDKVTSQNEIASQEAIQLKSIAADQAELRQEQALASTLIQQQQAALASAKTAKAQADTATANAKQVVANLTPAEIEQVTIGTGGGTGSMWTTYSGPLPVPTGRAAAAVAYAESKLGDEYVYAATGPNQFDCSGLTMMAWAAAGVSLPHNAAAQYDDTVHVSVDDLVPGDLLFYDYGEGITHVAIYVGNGMAVHAPHTGTVVQYGQINNIGPLVGASDPALGVS